MMESGLSTTQGRRRKGKGNADRWGWCGRERRGGEHADQGAGQLGPEAGHARWEVEWAFGPESRGGKSFSLFLFSFVCFLFFYFQNIFQDNLKTIFKSV